MDKEDILILTDLIEDVKIKKGSNALISILIGLLDKNGDGEISMDEIQSCFCPCLPKKTS